MLAKASARACSKSVIFPLNLASAAPGVLERIGLGHVSRAYQAEFPQMNNSES
jgi:hypothetical protein